MDKGCMFNKAYTVVVEKVFSTRFQCSCSILVYITVLFIIKLQYKKLLLIVKKKFIYSRI